MIRSLIAMLCVAALGACGSKPPKAAEPVAGASDGSAAATQPGTPAPGEPAAGEPAAGEPGEASKPANHPEPAKPDPAQAKADLLAAETGAWNAAKPALQKYCANCHSQGAKGATKKKLDHFDMTSYPIAGHHAATIGITIRDVLGLSGKKATMPFGKPGAVAGDDLAAIKAWTDAWDAADKGGAHPAAGDHPDH